MSHPFEEMGNPFFMICNKTSSSSLIDPKRTLITIPHTFTALQAVQLLSSHRISSCPVLDQNGQCLGSIDFLSILKLAQSQNLEQELKSIQSNNILESKTNFLTTLLVSDILPLCQPLIPYFVENPVSQLIDILNSVHRVALYKQDYELLTTLSQSDVIRFLITIIDDVHAKNPSTLRYAHDINRLCSLKLQDLHLLHSPVSLPSTSSLQEAISLCVEKNYRVVAVVNDEGQIVGDFCVEKLSLLLGILESPVEFMNKYNLSTPNLTNNLTRSQLFSSISLLDWVTKIHHQHPNDVPCISKDASFDNTLRLMITAHSKTHHLWVISDDKKPLFIVTMTDILHILKSADVNIKQVSDGLDLRKLWK